MDFVQNRKQFLWGVLAGGVVALASIVGVLQHPALLQAVTFDSDIVPTTGSSMNLGVAPGQIRSVNNVLFFDGQSAGIGGAPTQTSTVRLEVTNGGLRFNNVAARPACDATNGPARRGTMWFTPGTGVQKDSLAVCYRDGTGVYGWAEFQGK